MNTIDHAGYVGSVYYNAEDECFYAEVLGITDAIITEADNVKDLKANFIRVIDGYLETCLELGKEPEKQASGRFQVRLPPELHAKAIAHTSNLPQKTSLNDLIISSLENSLA